MVVTKRCIAAFRLSKDLARAFGKQWELFTFLTIKELYFNHKYVIFVCFISTTVVSIISSEMNYGYNSN